MAAVKSLTSAAGGTGAITGVPKSKSSTDATTSILARLADDAPKLEWRPVTVTKWQPQERKY